MTIRRSAGLGLALAGALLAQGCGGDDGDDAPAPTPVRLACTEITAAALGRNDLAHVDPSELGPTTIGQGEAQSKAPEPAPATAVVSRGFVRGNSDRLMLIPGGAANGGQGGQRTGTTGLTMGATALKEEPQEQKIGEAEMSKLAFAAPAANPSIADKRAEAKMKGYVGEACPECANFTLVRNGTCLKCDTCGSTTGCS